ncbi:Zn-ribbon domain-containing OB-fold protein [Haloferax sp. YSMS24]|uniref:Zn-ribbon domain-containing OB-fold protein n=1 Tax=Haloferax sp. YSMS24 TaxID=3388425 RepID=UPI00398D1889
MTEYDTYYDVGLGGGRNTLTAKRFWEASAEERFVVQQCGDCSEHVFPPQDVCPYCWADALAWTEVSGDGVVHSFSTVYIDLHEAWAERVPYTVAFVRLAEGPLVVSNLVDCDPDEAEIGMDVEVVFGELPGEDGVFPQFRPATGDSG